MIVIFLLIFFSIFATKYELADSSNAFTNNKPKKTDTYQCILYKLEELIKYDQKTIKWRRILVVSAIIAIMIPLVLYQKFPSNKEALLIFAVCYTLMVIQWNNYTENTSIIVSEYAQRHLYKLNKLGKIAE